MFESHDDVLVFAWEPFDASPFVTLTPAERHVLEAIVEGLSNAAIAARRRSAERTVANQCAAIFRKLRVRSRAELLAKVFGNTSR